MVQHNDSREAFVSRLNTALKAAGRDGRGKGAWLAKITNLKPKSSSKWLNAESRPEHDHLVIIAQALGVREEWLEYGKGPMREGDQGEPQGQYQVEIANADRNVQPVPEPMRYHRYPVIGYGQAGEWTEAVAPYEPGAEPHMEATDYRAHGRAFWLEIQGESMTAPAGVRPSVPEGTLVLFDTGIDPVPGKLVVALLEGSGEATFKQLIEDGGRRYLRAMNPAYPLIEINGNCRILGVAVEAKTRL